MIAGDFPRHTVWLAGVAAALLLAGSCLMVAPRQTVLTISVEPSAQPADSAEPEDWIDDSDCIADECCWH